MENISGEEIPRIQHHLVNQFEELSGSSSNRRKRSWGTPDPDAKVIALSQAELENSGNYVCNLCDLRFVRLQNLEYHLRGHNNYNYELPEKGVVESARKKVYMCPDSNCVYHNPTRALSSTTALRKHYMRKHKEKLLRCDRCLHEYALKADLNAHVKKCIARNYEWNHSGSQYSRIDGFEIHKAECQLQGPVSNELVHISKTMSEVNDLQVPNIPTKFGPSRASSINNIDEGLRKCDGFETSNFIVPEPPQPIVQMPNSSQQNSLHVDFYQEKSIWELTYLDLL
ncbi:hypothetical protein POM88_012659 [Heracleum sosnowskyi]|uniref:C2H2-type domain-containing protein n=1 Tax=Heracleum sosnowskyi TaxID=360622 RepID=A0AAD8N3M3_9APIA|nr:hypothetical protein POM88_012659 [Heracleum sosnowskyi]